MAGRILPIALAAVAGVSIGVATFDGEFQKQQRQRLEKEYQREVAILAPSKDNTAPSTPSTTAAAPQTAPLQSQKKATSSSWSDMLGFWAWKGGESKTDSSTINEILTDNDSREGKR